MLELRDYQREALDKLYSYWACGGGRGLIVLPTGAGKALLLAKLIEELLADYPDIRIGNITHSSKLVGQNFKEFIGLSPFAPAGIYSAGLGRRDAKAQILFGGIQSLYKRPREIGHMDLVLIDEAHAISRDSTAMYGQFFSGVADVNSAFRQAGTTATDYRTDSGSLTEGDDRLFDDVVYEIGIGELMDKGYLTRLTSQKTTAKIDLKGVHTRGGDYVPREVADAAERIIEEAIAEDMTASIGRRAGMFFCASKANSIQVRDAIRRHGRTCESLTSDNSHEAERIYRDFEAGKIWAVSSVGMLTTGANFPFVDFISLLFSTKSPVKIVQVLGRGTRNCAGKIDCLVADHGKNLSYHGPIDKIEPKAPSSGDGEQPRKLCPTDRADSEGKYGCEELLPISVMTCHCCGYIFPPSEEDKITAKQDDAPVLSTERPWSKVAEQTFSEHAAKQEGNPPSVKVQYRVGFKSVNQWLCPQHHEHPDNKSKYAKPHADRFWRYHGGQEPPPMKVTEWLARAGELQKTGEVQLDYSKNPKWPTVADYRVGAVVADNDNSPEVEVANDNAQVSRWADLDEIPF